MKLNITYIATSGSALKAKAMKPRECVLSTPPLYILKNNLKFVKKNMKLSDTF
jgi:hypothetical protein